MKRLTNKQKIAKARSIHSVVIEADHVHLFGADFIVKQHAKRWGENGGKITMTPLPGGYIRVDMHPPYFLDRYQ